MSAKFQLPHGYDLVGKYRAGMSIKQLGSELSVSRDVVRRLLVDADVEIRGIAEQGRIVWTDIKLRGRDAVHAQVAGANVARRGSADPFDRRTARARTRRDRLTYTGRHEIALAQELTRAGIFTTRQVACGPYNLNLFLPEHGVAVEVVGDTNNPQSPRFAKRTEYILDAGIWIVFAYFDRNSATRSFFDHRAVAQKVLALLDTPRSNPATRGKYWVIWGNGEDKPLRRAQLNDRAVVAHSKG